MQEQEVLKILRTNSEIIIKEADKGGATIIMNKEDYKELVETILNDEVYYTKLNTSPEKELNLKYKKFLQKFKSQMTEKEFDYLLNFEVKTSNFYGLPKVHKSKRINEKCKSANSGYVEITDKISDLKLRPIVAGPSCHTHRLSNLIDILLRPYTEHVTSYLRDTTDFLNNLPDTIPKDTILTSFDIEALYSNIPHKLGLEAIKFVCLFVCFCCFTSHVNSYGHCGTVSSLNHTFSWAGLSKRLTSNLCTYFRL